MVNDPLMDSERNLERKQSQVKKTENNFIPYDPNTDEERSSGESYNSGLTASTQEAPKVDPIKYDLEKPSDPLSEISSAESYQLNPVEIQEFREEELLKPPPIKEGENPFYINEAEGIINPREFEALEKRTEEFSQEFHSQAFVRNINFFQLSNGKREIITEKTASSTIRAPTIGKRRAEKIL